MNTTKELLNGLAGAIREELLTPAKSVDDETFVCLTEATPHGIAYHQGLFDALPEGLREQLKGKEKGHKVGGCKIVAIYHYWASEGPSIWSAKKI